MVEFLAVLLPTPLAVLRPRVRWKPLDLSFFKINFDRAIFRNENKSGIGVVVRDHTGSIIASLAQLISLALQPVEIEAVAATWALEFGQEIGISEVVLEGDSELIIESLKAGGNTTASVEPLIQDALVFSRLYTKLLYSHCRIDGNKLAHSLASYSINVSDYVAWMGEVPHPLQSVAQCDLANLANQVQ